jgi:hypothetical protein
MYSPKRVNNGFSVYADIGLRPAGPVKNMYKAPPAALFNRRAQESCVGERGAGARWDVAAAFRIRDTERGHVEENPEF